MDESSIRRGGVSVDGNHFVPVDFHNQPLEGKRKILTDEGIHVLQQQNFQSFDFWEGYKLYCYGRYSQCRRSRGLFLKSKMGQVVTLIHDEDVVRWGYVFDEKVRQVWAMMEEYAEVFIGQDWRNLRPYHVWIQCLSANHVTFGFNVCQQLSQVLGDNASSSLAARALMEEFDDVKQLSSSDKGCLLLQLVEEDEYGTERLHRESHAVEVKYTNIFDELQTRLKRVGSNLDSLRDCSASSKALKNKAGKRCMLGLN